MERNIFNENISVFQIRMKDQGGRLVQDSRQHFVRTLGQYLQAGAIYADTSEPSGRRARHLQQNMPPTEIRQHIGNYLQSTIF